LARDVQIGRYASLVAAPTEAQTNLLSRMVTVRFPSRVKTVGGAVQHLDLLPGGNPLVLELGLEPGDAGLGDEPGHEPAQGGARSEAYAQGQWIH
jgi:hypothetical protein